MKTNNKKLKPLGLLILRADMIALVGVCIVTSVVSAILSYRSAEGALEKSLVNSANMNAAAVDLCTDKSINRDDITTVLNKNDIGEGSNIVVIDNKGHIVACSENEQALMQAAQSDKNAIGIIKKTLAGETGYASTTVDNKKMACAYGTVNKSKGLYVILYSPMNNFTKQFKESIIIDIVILILIAIAGVIVVKKSVFGIANPLKIVSNRMTELANGDVSSDMPEITSTSCEIQGLNNSIKGMISTNKVIITDITDLLEHTAECDFSHKSDHSDLYIGDYKEIIESYDRMRESLTDSFSKIRSAAEQVSYGSSQVSSGSQTLAQGATEQASSIEELSASIANISEKVTDNANDAEKAKVLTENAAIIMNDSMSNMSLAKEAMNKISKSSDDISKVIKAIDDIAFQTNILALNAAVEAARAGSAGKGFAVVADEVRNLSQKSAEAAKSTAELIENSIKAVKDGTELVDKTDAGFMKVNEMTSDTEKIINQIATKSDECSTSIKEISQGIEQISSVVQMNSATSEESAAASEELSSQAEGLKGLIEKYKF